MQTRSPSDAPVARGLQMVDRACPELDRKWNRARLRELVSVEAQRQALLLARNQEAPRLGGVERQRLSEQ